jgi:crotonobetainyl-CoA:carnitine CoA-transferase CaiB-like acyl-CoA transferase
VVLDATSKADIDQLRELMASADVLIDSLDVAARKAFQINHAALRMSNEALVIADISWFGKAGPYRDYKATDSVRRALAGLVQLVGPEQGPPAPVEDYQGVPVGGLTAFIALMAALQDTTTGRGRTFEISLHEANLAVADYNVALAWAGGAADKRSGVNRFAPNYPLGIHRCKSGWIGVTVVTPVQWKTFCQLLDVADLASDPAYAVNRGRLANADVIEARFAPQFLATHRRGMVRAGSATSPALCGGADHGGSACQSGASPSRQLRAGAAWRARLRSAALAAAVDGDATEGRRSRARTRRGHSRAGLKDRAANRRAHRRRPGGFRLKACASSTFRWDGRDRKRPGISPISAAT